MTIETNRSNLSETRVVPDPHVELESGQCRLRIDHFALTTNNITYGVFGDMLRYWDVFPATDSPAEWGRIPTWGFAEVVESRSDELAIGDRLFGFLPMSAETIITPGKADDRGVSDIAPHRKGLAGAYNRYQRTSSDPIYEEDRESQQMLLYPLFFTSFVIDDFLTDHNDFGASQVIVSSASSKTAIGVAWLAASRGKRVIGLTSKNNQCFVEQLSIYSEILLYEDVESLAQTDSVYIDIAGNQDLVRGIHEHLDGVLHHSMVVGNTNWNHVPTSTQELVPPRPEFLFAPAQIAKRTEEWGRDELDRRLGQAWDEYSHWCDGWIRFVNANGQSEVIRTFETLREGRPDPKLGYICSIPKGESK
jgi:hypothetical protein